MSWLHPALFWVWLPVLIGVPVLIHLINLLRHRRVRWAPMAFLLESKKKNQYWIRFKEILLLLLRMAAVAAVVLMLAGWMVNTHFSRLFSGGLVHHVLLVDDSLSMTDQWDNIDAVQQARGVVQHILDRAAQHSGTHLVSVVRFSEAAQGGSADVIRQPIRLDLPQQRKLLVESVRASQLAGGPLEAVKAVKEKIGKQQDENLVVYLISDFRARQWRESKSMQDALRQLTEEGAKLELVRCVDRVRPNMAITALRPAAGILAADVPLKMEVEVTNYDSVPRNVQVLLQSQTSTGDSGTSARQALPSVTLDKIEPGQSARQSFSARFPTPGDHEVYAKIAADALTADNERFCVVHLPADVPVLIVDGRPGSIDARLLSTALSPRQRIRTGIKPQIEKPNYLREQPLEKFAAIYLVNIGALDAGEAAALTSYVAAGGGVVFFAGEATRPDFVNQTLYADGKGIFPLPLVSPASLIMDQLDKTPDLDVDLKHPIFRRTFAGQRNSFLSAVLVDRYFAVPKDWAPPKDGSVSVLARMRNKAPLIVERRMGKGTCIAVLTTAAPIWNNWARSNPSFVIAMLETQVYLSGDRTPQRSQQVGRPIAVEFDKDEFATEVQFTLPTEKKKGPQRQAVQSAPDPKNPEKMTATLGTVPERGIYEARLARGDGSAQTRRYAANIPAGEGDLALLSPSDLQLALGNVKAEIHDAAAFSGPITQELGLVLGMQWPFFVVLLGLLAGEQVLAYSASYHPAKGEGRR